MSGVVHHDLIILSSFYRKRKNLDLICWLSVLWRCDNCDAGSDNIGEPLPFHVKNTGYIIWWNCNTLFWSITFSIAICIVNYFIVLQIRLALREYFLVDKEYSRVKCDTFAVMEPLKGGQNLNNFDISSIRAS